ncbi:MAG: hypothetical protein ACFFCE_05700 [Promethearchaeota archaeon]
MADDSELDYIRTFLGKVHTSATVKHISESKSIYSDKYGAGKTHRMLVEPGEVLSADNYRYVKRYKIKLSETNEANLMSAFNNILEGILKFNRRETITDYTRPSVMNYIKLAYSNKAYEQDDGRWYEDIFLDITWSTS